MTKIAVLGAGNIGGTLGKKWATAGHEVAFGVRDPRAAKVQKLLAEIEGRATAVPLDEAVAEASVVLFAIPGRVMSATAVRLRGHLAGKILIDATNNVGQPVMNNLEALAENATGAALYRAFSNLGWENFAEPVFGGVPADLFYCACVPFTWATATPRR